MIDSESKLLLELVSSLKLATVATIEVANYLKKHGKVIYVEQLLSDPPKRSLLDSAIHTYQLAHPPIDGKATSVESRAGVIWCPIDVLPLVEQANLARTQFGDHFKMLNSGAIKGRVGQALSDTIAEMKARPALVQGGIRISVPHIKRTLPLFTNIQRVKFGAETRRRIEKVSRSELEKRLSGLHPDRADICRKRIAELGSMSQIRYVYTQDAARKRANLKGINGEWFATSVSLPFIVIGPIPSVDPLESQFSRSNETRSDLGEYQELIPELYLYTKIK